MHVFDLTRALIDIPSITPEEEQVGLYLYDYLSRLCSTHNGIVEKVEVEPKRWNVFAFFGTPVVTLSTHMDTVPPYVPSRVDDEFIWGRGACDTKGIIASMITAAERLLEKGVRDFGLLFVVGEERNSAGAHLCGGSIRADRSTSSTASRLRTSWRLGSKGALRYELVARGRMAHSAYPELGDSAINKLLDALDAIRKVELPVDDVLGPSTLNIGTIHGGRAPNVIPDEARAEIFIRLVGDSAEHPQGARRRPSATRSNSTSCSKFRRSGSPPSKDCRRPWSPTPPTSRRSSARGANHCCSAPEPFTWHTRSTSACRSRNFSTQWKFIRKWSSDYNNNEENRSRHPRRHRHGGPAFHQVSRRSPVVPADMARRKRAVRRQAIFRSREMASRRYRARVRLGT